MVAALAAPIVGALGGGALATAGVNLALYAGVSAASILLQMSMAEEQKQEIGTKLSDVLGGAVNQSIHFGQKETAGSFIYKNVWGRSGKTPNAFLARVWDLGDRPVEDYLDYLWGAGEKCNFDAGETDTVDGVNLGHPIPKFNSGGGHRLWAKIHTGDQTTADNYLVAKFGSDPHRPWTEDHVGRGRAYLIVTQKYDKKQPEGEIDVVPVLDRSRYYDWRSDSTNGGSGSQRYGNSGTYGVEPGNPVVIIYNIMRGIYYGDEWLYGGQKWPARRFDNDSWTAAANKCDTNVGNKGGGGSHKWARVGGEIDLSEEPWTVITRLLRACNGRIVESGGVFKIYVGGIGASVHDFTDDDVIVSEELTGRLFPMREEIANTINGTYVEPQNAGEAKAYKTRSKQDYIDADGDVRESTIDFEYVRENRQAQRMAAQALKENRRFRTFVVAFWTQARKLEPCDVVTWTSERYGFEDKEFIAGDVVLRDDGVVIVNLREADNADADWDPDADEDEFETGVFEEIEAPTQTLTATVTAVPFTDDAGKERRPAIRIEAALDDDFVDCRALRYQVRKKNGDQKIIHRGRSMAFFEADNEDYGDITFTSNAIATLKAKWVQVRFRIEPESDRDTDWSDWADHEVNLNDLGIDDDDTDSSTLAAPTGLTLTKVQTADDDGTVKTFIKMSCTAPAWATVKTDYEFHVVVAGDDTYVVKSGDTIKRFRVQKTGVLHTVKVRGVKGVGNKGDWSSTTSLTPAKKTAAPTTVTGLNVDRRANKNVLTWTRNSDTDLREYLIYRSTANNFGTASIIGRTFSTRYPDDDNLTKGVTYYYWVVPVDRSDNPGAQSSSANGAFRAVEQSDADNTVRSAPSGVSLTQANKDVDLDGTVDIALLATFSSGVSGATDYEFELSSSTTAGGTYTVVETKKSTIGKVWFKANTQLFYKVRAWAINWDGTIGTASSLTSAVQPAGTTGAPAAPSSYSVSPLQLGFLCTWAAPSELDFDFTEIAIRSSAGTPSASQTVATTSKTTTAVYWPSAADAYVYARHVNTSGLASSWVLISSGAVNINPVTNVGGGIDHNNIGTANSGSVNAGAGSKTQLTISFKCTSNTSGVTLNLGSKTITVDFEDQKPYSHTTMESGGGSFSFSKSGGSYTSCELVAITFP